MLILINIVITYTISILRASYNPVTLIPEVNILIPLITTYIVLITTGIILTESYVLGIINSIILTSILGGLVISYYFVSLIVSIIVVKKYQKYDSMLSLTIRELDLKPDIKVLFHNFAIYFASLSLTLFIAGYIGLSNNIFFRSEIQITLLPLLVLVSMIPILLFHEVELITLAGLCSGLGVYGLIPLTYIIARGLSHTIVQYSVKAWKGIGLGLLKAVLKHGYPSGTYIEIGIKKDRIQWYWKKASGILRVDLDELPNNHFVIVGASGMGKSRLAKNIILQTYIYYKYNFIVLDPHGEYGDIVEILPNTLIIDASNTSLNPLELKGSDPGQRAHQLSYTIQSLFKLGPLQRQIIEEIIIETYKKKGIFPEELGTWNYKPPTFRDVLDTAVVMAKDDELIKRVIPYLKILSTRVFSGNQLSMGEVLSKPTIIQLNKLSSDYVRVLYMDTFLHKLLNTMYSERRSNKQLIVIDEAHQIFRRGSGRLLASRLLMESRKYGLGFIVITQQALALTDAVYQNASVKIIFNTSEPKNLEYVSKLLGGLSDRSKLNALRTILPRLSRNEFVARIISSREEIYLAELIDYTKKIKEYILNNKTKMLDYP